MRVSVFFRALMVVVLVTLSLGEDSLRRSKGKKAGKSRGSVSNQGSRGKMRKLWISLDPDFINSPDPSPVYPYSSLSMSPWTYKASFDESRIPSRIFEAECERTGCMTKDGHEDNGLKSQPIYYQILVLRRVKGKKKKKKYSFQLEKMTISVGCTCTLPSVIHQMS
ncbi:hypothetical protein NFI96_031899 [Prochilodus magdalenae]|nr:hypothetical protein NFI96_031899 [Prochilodus magdalenae]